MTYEETLHYLFTSIPVFQNQGASAYKPGLDTSIALDNQLGNPHQSYKTIHIAGTNGKGSTSHLLAAILQESGYKVGLYTSPHLVDFRERIRVNGQQIPESFVIDFVSRYRTSFEPLKPSFFELTSSMAFDYFRYEKVDFAVIETGLGGRLDSTNIITPELSVITNISLDHTQFLGHTLQQIASEKAGIIKPGIPALIGEANDSSVAEVFKNKAKETGAPLSFAESDPEIQSATRQPEGTWLFETRNQGTVKGELGGSVQKRNAETVLWAVRLLKDKGVAIPNAAVQKGFAQVVELTGLMGRWQTLQNNPRVICDTGHNTGGWEYLSNQLREEAAHCKTLRMIVGMVNDKDINGVLALMPQNAQYYFTQAAIQRAMPATDFAGLAHQHNLKGKVYPVVGNAIEAALQDADENDLIFIGGSTFIVADALPYFMNKNK